jgi:uncharacterized protein (TIRG00374 family)
MEIVYKLTSRKTLALVLVLFVALLVVAARFIDWKMVWDMLSAANRPILAGAAVMLVLGYISYAERWRYLLGDRAGYRPVFHTANVGSMLNALLPGRPGDYVRILLLHQKSGAPVFAITSSIVVERWYEQIMRLAAFGGAVIFGAGAQVSALTTLGSAAYLVLSFLVMIFLLKRREWVLQKAPPVLARLPRLTEERARSGLTDLIDGLSAISSPSRLLTTLFWSLVTWSLFWGYHYLCLLALHPYLAPNQLLAISLGSLALVPPSATTVPGVYQVSMVIPLALVGYSRSLLTTYSLVMNVLEMAVVLLLGLWGTFAIGLTIHELLVKAQEAIANEIKSLTGGNP